ncbi:unnamed protein product, partial [Mesorhabditis spiculigera]
MNQLPANYTFELPKTIWKIRHLGAKNVALQFPEGLLMYACLIADILEKHTGCETVIMGDVTYGACCVDDFTAKALGCDLLVHYGHSCLVPIQNTEGIAMLYIFVNIEINLSHFVDCLKANFEPLQRIAIVSTIQFIPSLQAVRQLLINDGYTIVMPQCKPLSPGEILGCTSPRLGDDVDRLIYLGDGRFHLESIMIHNPKIAAFQYDPYSRKLTREHYDHSTMRNNRGAAVRIARECTRFGVVLGALGRQGNTKVLQELVDKLKSKGKEVTVVVLSEIFPAKLALFDEIECWVQIACPRLSIDWGTFFTRPLLTPYELNVALDSLEFPDGYYPMDFYAYESKGPWTPNHESHRPQRVRRRAPIVVGQSAS